MGKIKMRYLVKKTKAKKDFYYWQPKKFFIVAGEPVKCPFKSVRVGKKTGSMTEITKDVEALNKQLDAWRNGQEVKTAEGTVGWLINKYKSDPEYKKLKKSTRTTNDYLMREIASVFEDIPIGAITPPDAREFCLDYEDNPRKPSALAAQGRVLFNYAKFIGKCSNNPFENLRIPKLKPREAVWPMDKIELVKQVAIEMGLDSIALAVQMGLDTGQRPADLRLLTWNRYENGKIKLRQGKTNVWVEVRVMQGLANMLANTECKSPMILVDEETGKPYSKDVLCRKFREVCDKAGIGEELQFRDLRRTAVVRLAENGCTVAEISAITGHSLSSAAKILGTYLPPNSVMADNAIAKLEKVGTNTVDVGK